MFQTVPQLRDRSLGLMDILMDPLQEKRHIGWMAGYERGSFSEKLRTLWRLNCVLGAQFCAGYAGAMPIYGRTELDGATEASMKRGFQASLNKMKKMQQQMGLNTRKEMLGNVLGR